MYVCMSVADVPMTNVSSFKTTNTNANTSVIQFITNYIINE